MTLDGRGLGSDLQGAFGSEVYASPQAYLLFPIITGQSFTTGWVDQQPNFNQAGAEWLPTGFNAPGGATQGFFPFETLALQVGNAPNLTKWWGMAARRGDFPTASGARIGGARRLGFYVAGDVGANPHIVWRIRGFRNGSPFEEIKITDGLTHEKQAGWVSWAANFSGNISPRPVASAFYNPNSASAQLNIIGATNATPIVITTADPHSIPNGSTVNVFGVLGNTAANGTRVTANATATTFELVGSAGNGAYIAGGGDFVDYLGLGYGGTHRAAAVWGRLPLAAPFRSQRAYDGILSVEKIEASGVNADTIAVVTWKTVDFGLRRRIRDVEDVIGGYVEVNPFHAFLDNAFIWAPVTLVRNVEILAPVNLENMVYDSGENVLSFTRTVPASVYGDLNPHVYSNGTNEIDLHGELVMGSFDMPWKLTLDLRERGRL